MSSQGCFPLSNSARRQRRRVDRFVLAGSRPPTVSRIDPISGERAWHDGADFAGREGSDILAVASGVVSWSGYRSGYGTMVEVSHGDGLSTRYAHNQQNLVDVGDLVRRGDVIALMGSSGRSTGPHVHFEVFKNGRAVDPASYVRRTHR